MILKTCFLLVLSVAWEVSGASFSTVFLQTGPEVAPVEQLNYAGQSFAYANPQISQYNTAPVGYEYPLSSIYGYGTPCTTSGCFYPGQAIASVAQIAPSPNLVTYNAPVPNPVVYSSGLNELPGYQYSYGVVDHGSGDQKVHSELSNGGLVRGEYAFLQPDGFVREVQYVANDAQGFNAIVKNFLPVEEIKYTESSHHAPPCHESKNGALTHESNPESTEEHHEAHKDHEARHGSHEDGEAHGDHLEPKTVYIIEELSGDHGKSNVHEEVHKEKEEHGDHTEHENLEEHTEHHEETHEKEEEKEIEIKVTVPENTDTHADIIEISHIKHQPHEHEVHEHHEHEVHEHHEPPHVETLEAASHEHGVVEPSGLLSYNDVIKCIQAAMAKANNHPSVPRPTSPLTYLVFNKPC